MTDKTTGERIVEEWDREWMPYLSHPTATVQQAESDLSRRIDEAVATAEGEVGRLREALTNIQDHDWVENALDPQWAAKIAREALAKKEG